MKRSMATLALCGVIGACAPRTTPPAPASARPASRADARARVWAIADTLKLSRAAAIARYGRPLVYSGDTVRSFNTGILDSLVRLRFPHFEATYDIHAGRELLRHITIETPEPDVLAQVGPGATRQSLVSYLGAPDADEDFEEGRLLLYELPRDPDSELGNVLNIHLVGGRVRWISWIYFPQPSWPAR